VLLERLGGAELRDRLLAPALSGEFCGAVAYPEADDGFDCELRVGAGGALELHGVLTLVQGACDADWVVVTARAPGGSPGVLLAAPLRGPGVSASRTGILGLQAAALGEVRFDGCPLAPSDVLAEAGRGAPALAESLADERRLLSAALLASADRVLGDTLIFVGARAFGPGRVLGDQQVVRHRLADLAAEHAVAAALLREAGAEERTEPAAAVLLMLACTEACARIAEGCMQLLGARGYMADHPAARLYRDVLTLGLLAAGDPARLAHLAGEDLFTRADAAAGVLP
jgi:alkylation response protein AidB-like acyl-CoA dehydrogenase